MPANLDQPKIIIPSGGSALFVGTGADVLVHTCVANDDELDAVTVEAGASSSQTVTVRCPTTTGGTVAVPGAIVANQVPAVVIDRWTFQNGAAIYVNGTSAAFFKVSVERYPVSR